MERARAILVDAPWVDGRATAGVQSAEVKRNEQLPQEAAETRALQQIVMAALNRRPLFFSAELPKRVFPPLFNRYAGACAATSGGVGCTTWTCT